MLPDRLRLVLRHPTACGLLGSCALVTCLALIASCSRSSGDSSATTPRAHPHRKPPKAPVVPPPPPADFILRAGDSEGDHVITEGRFGEPQAFANTGIPPEVLAECGHGDDRELAVRLELTTIVQSSLPVKVGLGNFHSGAEANNETRFVMDYTEGPTCLSQAVTTETQVELGRLYPHDPHPFTVWVILNEALTPDHPVPSAKTLGEGWSMAIPILAPDGYPDIKTTGQGPRVISCEQEPFIVPAGTPPTTAAIGTEGENAPCTVQIKPVPAF